MAGIGVIWPTGRRRQAWRAGAPAGWLYSAPSAGGPLLGGQGRVCRQPAPVPSSRRQLSRIVGAQRGRRSGAPNAATAGNVARLIPEHALANPPFQCAGSPTPYRHRAPGRAVSSSRPSSAPPCPIGSSRKANRPGGVSKLDWLNERLFQPRAAGTPSAQEIGCAVRTGIRPALVAPKTAPSPRC